MKGGTRTRPIGDSRNTTFLCGPPRIRFQFGVELSPKTRSDYTVLSGTSSSVRLNQSRAVKYHCASASGVPGEGE